MKIATFYSFKGGVGRSMAAMNVAWLLTSKGRRVVLIDADLEAPGISMSNDFIQCTGAPKLGILDYIAQYFNPPPKPKPLKSFARRFMTGEDGAELLFIPVANLKKPADPVCLPWRKLRKATVLKKFTSDFRRDLEKAFDPDYVIIDARTGFNEISGLFTVNLPDIVVLFTGLNDQNLQGTKWALEHLKQKKAQAHLVVFSPLPDGEVELKKERIKQAMALLRQQSADLPRILIPYHARAALKEELFVRDFPDEPITKAYHELKQAFIKLNPADIETAVTASRVHLENNRTDQALASLEQVRQTTQRSRLFLNERAFVFLQKGLEVAIKGEYEKAIEYFDSAIRDKPDSYNAIHDRAVALEFMAEHQEAIRGYDQALKIKPDLHEAHYSKGISLTAMGRRDEAIKAYDRALKIKPDYHEALNNKGNALAVLGRRKEAIKAYDQALKIKPDFHKALNNKGVSLHKLGRREEAIKVYDQALKIKPDDSDALANKGISLAALGRLEEAIQVYNQALKIKPNNDQVVYYKACALALVHRKAKAMEQMRRVAGVKEKRALDSILHRKARALEQLRWAVKFDAKWAEEAAKDDDFKELRDDPEFQAITRAGKKTGPKKKPRGKK